MFQLVITVVAIALTAAVAVASINYLPFWFKTAASTELLMLDTAETLVRAYIAQARTTGQGPAVDANSADGGLQASFGDVLKFTPGAPVGFIWTYGQHPTDSSRWSGMHYFCLTPVEGSQGASEGVWRGIGRVQARFSTDQLVLGESCGDTSAAANPSSYPAMRSVTLFVTYVPGVHG